MSATPTAAAEPPPESLFAPGRRALSIGAVALITMMAFEALAVTTAMPAIALALDGLTLYALAFGGALASAIVSMTAAGMACDRFSPARSLAVGAALFFIGLCQAGFATDMSGLVLGRIVQGLGSGAIGVVLYVVIGRVLPPVLRPRMFALLATAWVLPALVGPALAGWMVAAWGWPAVFFSVATLMPLATWLVLPAAGAAAAAPSLTGRTVPSRALERLAWAALAGMAALALNQAAAAPAAWPAAGVVAAALVLAGSAQRLLPRGSLRAARGLPSLVALRGLLAAAFFAAEAYLPLWLNLVRGWSLPQAGLALTLGALCWFAGSQWQARLPDSPARVRAVGAGLALVALGTAVIAGVIAAGLVGGWALVGWGLAGLGIGISFPAISVLTLAGAAHDDQGRWSAALQLGDTITSTFVMAMCGAAFAAGASTPAFVAVFVGAAALAGLGALLAPRAAGATTAVDLNAAGSPGP